MQLWQQSKSLLSESDKVFWVSLNVIKNYEHGWMGHVISWTIKQIYSVAKVFSCWSNGSFFPQRIFSNKDSGQVHVLPPICIWFRVEVVGRIVGVNSKVCSISKVCSCNQKSQRSESVSVAEFLICHLQSLWISGELCFLFAIGRYHKTNNFAYKVGLYMAWQISPSPIQENKSCLESYITVHSSIAPVKSMSVN